MRLVSLKLKNYRQFKEANIEFPDGVTGIVGLNGAGKSTIIEAIAFALYGTDAARTDKLGIRRVGSAPGSAVEATLELEIGGSAYTINRVLKGQSQTGAGSIVANGKVIADSVRGLDKEIKYLLGMDFPSFKTSFLAKQKELNALTELTPNQRKDVIIRMLGIDSIDKAIDLVRKEAREEKVKVEVMRKSLKDDNVLASEAQALKNKIDTQNKQVDQLEAEIEKLEKEQSSFTDKFNQERKLYEEFNRLNNQKTEIDARLTGLKKREEEIREEILEVEKLEKEIPALKEAADEFKKANEKLIKVSASLEKQKEQIDERLEKIRKEYKEIQAKEKMLKAGEPCPTCGQPLADFKKIKEHFAEEKQKIENEADKLKKQKEFLEKWESMKEGADRDIIEQVKFDPVEFERDQASIKKLRPLAEKYPGVRSKVEEKKALEASLKKISAEMDGFAGKQKTIAAQLKSIPFDSKKHEKITAEFNESKELLDGKYHQRNEIKITLGHLDGELKAKEKEIAENSAAKKSIESTVKSQEERNRLEELMKEYRTHLISRIQPELAEISGRLFIELTNGKYQGVELDDNYEMHIYDGGVKYPIARFSGGEADLANLCLRLAISQLIASSSGIETGFIMLDEIFGSQDPIRKNAILSALAQLSKHFRQIILITHVEDIKDTLENIIEVQEDESGVSRIKQ